MIVKYISNGFVDAFYYFNWNVKIDFDGF